MTHEDSLFTFASERASTYFNARPGIAVTILNQATRLLWVRPAFIMATGAEDFDRSFDYFATHQGGKEDSFQDEFADQTFVETDLFEFSAAESSFAEDDMGKHLSEQPVETTTVRVAVHEQLAALYDDFAQEGAMTVTGSIHVKAAAVTPFSVLLRDKEQNVQSFEVAGVVSECKLDATGGRELIVELQESQLNHDIPIASYVCAPELRPVPLLIKRRVSAANGFARVGFKIRTNPNNEHSITKMVIMLAVPPDVNGEHCKMSRKGGSWEELKRTLTWCVDSLEPGEALEIQAQFPLLEESEKGPKFPVLVRCEYPLIFSNVEVSTNEDEIQVNLTTSGRVLHRKV